MAQHLQAPFGLLHRNKRDSDDFDFDFDDDFNSHVETVASVTMAAIIGIIVGVIVLVVIVTVVVCFCVCRRKRTYSGRTLYSPAPTGPTTTTTYPAQTVYPQGYPQTTSSPYQPTTYPAPQYAAQLPPGQAPPPYPGPPVSGYPPQSGTTQTYPMATAGQNWQPPQQKLESAGYPGGMEQSHLQKASAPPPEF